MSNNICLPFSKATCEVFKLLLDLNVSPGDPHPLVTLDDSEDMINIVIGISGDLSGQVVYRFPKETTLEMVKIMSGMDISEVDDFVASAMGEVANIISGNAMTNLSQQQLACDILPPKVMTEAAQPLVNNQSPILATEVTTPIGEVELNIQLQPPTK
jgi:chemotaxis protein CheX